MANATPNQSISSGSDEDLLRENDQLRQRVAELQSLVELAPVGLGIDRDADCRRIDPNPARLGLEANASRTAPPDERPAFRVVRDGVEIPLEDLPMQVTARTGVPVNGSQCHILFENGDLIHLLGSCAPLFDDDDKPRGCIGAFVDITEQIDHERDLREARQTAENATRAKDLFLATLSHELRSPLSAIQLMIHMLKHSADLQSPEHQDQLQIAQEGIDMLARLIDDLLDVQRILNGKLSLHRRPLDLHTLVTNALEPHRQECATKGLTLTFRPAAHAHQIRGDAVRLQQVIGNVLNNAIKFTHTGGIDVETLSVDTNCKGKPGRFVRISVIDTGVGFSGPAEPLFRHFEQGAADTTRRFGGLGLGLAICKGIVEAHDGAMAAASEGPNRGTTITIDLPLAN